MSLCEELAVLVGSEEVVSDLGKHLYDMKADGEVNFQTNYEREDGTDV